jgi:hypothetical protein
MPMKRTTVWLTDQQRAQLARIEKRTGIHRAELIRRFLDAALKKEKR